MRYTAISLLAVVVLGLATVARAADQDADLAKQLANPVAALISVPIAFDYDEDIGPGDDVSAMRLTVKPVIPFSLNDDWNLISRTIVPLVELRDLPPSGGDETGLSDITQSLFFSPKQPTANGWIVGVGPVFLLPTATDDSLGSEKWGAGPTGVALKQAGPWTYGMLVNHIESFAGDDDRADVSATFLQPFLSYVTPSKTTFALNSESTRDWEDDEWSVPINLTVSQMLIVGRQPLQITLGARYWAQAADAGPEGWGLRMQLTLLYPK